MNENKRVTFRLNEEEVEKFKAFTEEQGINQAEGFAKLIEAMEINKAKSIVSDRAKEIEAVENHLRAIQSIYLTALEINQNAEQTIKENYSKELDSKDQIIIELQEKNRIFKEQLESNKEVQKLNKDLNSNIQELNKQLFDKIEEVKKVNESNSTLNGIVAEYKGYKVINTKLEEEIKDVEAKFIESETTIKDLNNKIGTLTEELNTIKSFYQHELKEVKQDHKQVIADNKKSYEESLKEVKQENKEIIKEIKAENKVEMVDLKNDCEATLKNLKLEHKEELQSIKEEKDSIIEELKKEIEKLKKASGTKKKIDKGIQ